MSRFLTTIILLIAGTVYAAPGDTTWVNVHNKTQMVWHERYSDKALLPDGSNTYHQILMYYRMGCANGGCSDWDYTTRVNIKHPTGEIDSNIASIDTISTNPLQIDTTWQTFNVVERFELARVITPYANGFGNNWSHDFVFDVTDYYSLLKDSVEIEIFYQGWSSGFSATIDFAFIEGTRPREVIRIDNVYHGSGAYRNTTDFENDHLPSRTMDIDPATKGIDLKVNFSGHGFVNSLNCAEFCKKDYYVNIGGNQVVAQSIWRDDCGLNPIWPQPGTWLYDRANWCPGAKSLFRTHNLSSHLSGATLDIDVNIEPYSYTVPPNESPASYNYSVQLIQYGDPNHQNDVELERIMAPSNDDEFGRMNPVCGSAIVKIRNKGANTLTSCTINYGLVGQPWKFYQWTGSLETMESEIVELPFGADQMDWWSHSGQPLQFEALVNSPNGQNDDYFLNNKSVTSFTPAPLYPGKMKFTLTTNAAAHETHWSLTDVAGNIMDSGDNLSNNTTYNYTWDLQPGCYVLSIKDRDKDGLSFFGNNDGGGLMRILNDGGPVFFKTLNPNFGTELRQEFTVGYSINLPEHTSEIGLFDVYPNPASEEVNISLIGTVANGVEVYINDLSGRSVYHQEWSATSMLEETISVKGFASGTYFVKLKFGDEVTFRKLIIR